MRRLGLVLLLAIGALPLAGCTVPVAALAGIGVDSDGHLVGYLRVCNDSIDGATLYSEGDQGESVATTADVGVWAAPGPVTRIASWSLSPPGAGWTALQPREPLVGGREYTLYGWTRDNSRSATGVTFTLADVGSLAPGQVLHWSGRSGGTPNRDTNEVSSGADFEAKTCRIID